MSLRHLKKTASIINGFIHDFASGIWLASMVAVAVLHRSHLNEPSATGVLNSLERHFFWGGVGAMVVILATGAGRTFTYVDNWYGEDAEPMRRRALIVKHIVLMACFGTGYLWVWGKVFHG